MTKIIFTSVGDDYEKEMDLSEINSIEDVKKEVEKSMYNGWSNKATWDANVHVTNTEEIYNIAKQFNNYTDFINLGLVSLKVTDMELVKILTHKSLMKDLELLIDDISK